MLARTRSLRFRAKPPLRQFAGQPARRPTRRPSYGSRPPSSLFDRETEREQLLAKFKKEPAAITVVLGPRNCGKTALLSSVLGQESPHAAFIDCRQIDGTTPALFVAALLASVLPKATAPVLEELHQTFPDMFRKLAAGVSGVKLGVTLGPIKEITLSPATKEKAVAGASAVSLDGLDPAFVALRIVLESWEQDLRTSNDKGFAWPVLVIDEANRLMQWRGANKPHLDALLAFFVSLTKAPSRCHVLMATSEYAFQDWLTRELGVGFWTTMVVGDFPEPEAREFFQSLLGDSKVHVDEDTWADVYQVCGGNAGDLKRLWSCIYPRTSEDDRDEVTVDWNQALVNVYGSVKEHVWQATQGGDGYSAVQYAAAALELLNSRYNTVGRAQMEQVLVQYADGAEVVPGQGYQVLLRLVQANVLAMRPPSKLARDIPADAFVEKGMAIVTAPSATHVFTMKQLRLELEAQVGNWKERQQQAQLPDTSSTALAGLAMEIQDVQTKIDGLEVQIEGLEAEIRHQLNNKPEGWLEVVGLMGKQKDWLRKEKEQLRKEKEQLRKEKEQLRKEKEQLRKENEQLRNKEERLRKGKEQLRYATEQLR